MARKSSPTIVQDELYPPAAESPDRSALDDARLVDLEIEQESPFLRGQKRVSARRGPLPKKALSRLKYAAITAMVLTVVAIVGSAAYRYGEHSWRFRLESSDDIDITGTHNVTHSQVMEVMGGDIGRNIFFIPLAERKAQLEKIPWVESASIMRFVPNRLSIEIHERTPVAFARIGSRIQLIDAGGTLMELPGPGKQKYSFPVIVGMNPGEPLSTRGPRMKIYNDLVRQLDSDGGHYSQDLSEVDVSDADDVKVLANDSAGAVLVHLGANDFLARYRIYVTHLQGWRQQFDKLESVDLRYDKQIIVNPDMQGVPRTAQLSPAAARAAMAAGVKPAALIHVVSTKPTAAPAKPAGAVSVAAKSAPAKTVPHAASKATAKHARAVRVRSTGKPATKKPSAAPASQSSGVTANKPAPTPAAPGSAKNGDTAVPHQPAPGTTTTSASGKKPSPAVAKIQESGSSPAPGHQDRP